MHACSNEPEIDIPSPPTSVNLSQSLYYHIDLNDRTDDTFKVTLFVDGLTASNNVYQFPVTVPGTYAIQDFGRFVTTFNVYDEQGNPLEVTQSSTSQWALESPENVYKIEFEIKETFDTPVSENHIHRMAGSSLEDTHVLLNTFAVLGYPQGLKDRDYYIDLDYPEVWTVGTSMQKVDEYFYAADYDQLADSPILLGNLTAASLSVDATDINIYTYSATGVVRSADMASDYGQVIADARAFLIQLPVDRYNFLQLFEGEDFSGALEHSYSSVYVLGDYPYEGYGDILKGIAAHEFFHIVVPLNIHSEIIADFNFADPTPSEHLWLYEGVTEWASDLMQYRNGSMTINALFNEFTAKIEKDTEYDDEVSLSDLSLTSYTPEGRSQFGNIYNRGAMTAALLDIRLLELSAGEKGLRELILELIDTYGPDHAFSEAEFFDVLVDLTYPEIEDFIADHIQGAEPLPYEAYFDKIGILYEAGSKTFSVNSSMSASQEMLHNRWRVNL